MPASTPTRSGKVAIFATSQRLWTIVVFLPRAMANPLSDACIRSQRFAGSYPQPITSETSGWFNAQSVKRGFCFCAAEKGAGPPATGGLLIAFLKIGWSGFLVSLLTRPPLCLTPDQLNRKVVLPFGDVHVGCCRRQVGVGRDRRLPRFRRRIWWRFSGTGRLGIGDFSHTDRGTVTISIA